MSKYHKDKCTKNEVFAFRQKVVDYLQLKGYKYKAIKAFKNYNGNVRIYTGDTDTTTRRRMGRKLVAVKREDGTYEGEGEHIRELKLRGGNNLYIKITDAIQKPIYIEAFRVDDWEGEKTALDEFFRSRLKILPTDCTCSIDQYGFCKNNLCIIHGERR